MYILLPGTCAGLEKQLIKFLKLEHRPAVGHVSPACRQEARRKKELGVESLKH